MIPARIAALFLLALPIAAMSGESTFFASPKEAVPALAGMLAAEDWPRLARCYDLDGSGIERSELESGRYFTRSTVAAGHPAGLDRWRHPFPPGYHYWSHTLDGNEALVQVGIEIDQGAGMVQRGLREFRMRRTAGGWQTLPDRADSLVRQWTAAALRAHVTRARATLDRPKAEAESNRLETLLATEPRARIALDDRLAEVERIRAETANGFASLMSVAREQTQEDRAQLSRLEQELQRLELERQLLGGLQARLTPVPRR
jgi:hypothetical protein